MRRKKILKIGFTSLFALFLALTGCAKADEPTARQDPIDNNDEIVEPVEVPEEPETKTGYTGELFAKRKEQVVYPSTTLYYPSSESATTMSSTSTNYADVLSLDKNVFTVISSKGETSSNYPYANKAGFIVLYSKASEATGDGSSLTISVIDGYLISGITIDFKQNPAECFCVKVGDDTVAGVDDSYTINASSFAVKNCNVGDGGTSKQVQINSIEISYLGPSARELIEDDLETISSLSYSYDRSGDGDVDKLDSAFTGVGSIEAWADKEGESGVVYAGTSAGNDNRITLNATNPSGIVTTSNSGEHEVKKIIVKWNSGTPNGRILQIYGKNEAYTASSQLYTSSKGTSICELTYDSSSATKEVSVTINSAYKYIGIRCKANTLYLDSIHIQWDVSFSYSNIAIRFGGFLNKTLWDRLDSESDIQGYGVLLSTKEYLGDSSIVGKYNEAIAVESSVSAAIASICESDNVKNFVSANEHPALANDIQKGDLSGDYYIWNLYKGLSTGQVSNFYNSVAYILIDGDIVFLDEVSLSAKKMAHELVNGTDYNDSSFDGSLYDLANLA